jgi:nucleoside-diphosphate-sugar epimerase
MNTRPISLVTGGAGFIGSNLCGELLKLGHEVICVDNLLTGSEENIKEYYSDSRFSFINLDISKGIDKKELNHPTVDYIFHLASPASPPKYRKWSIETMLVNSMGTYHLLKLAQNYSARFLLASTSEIYGNPLEHPQKETYYGNVNTIGTRSCYDESKRFAESITMEFFRQYKTSVRIVRIFNTYGPKMDKDDGRVVSNFINQAIDEKNLTLYGNGDQTRSLCYVTDLVAGILAMMTKDGLDGEVINLGNHVEMTVREIGEKILSLTNSRSKLESIMEKEVDDPARRKPDISKAEKLLGWSPKVSVDEGLTKTIEYFKNVAS